jgi:uncharacterized protein (UPF0248 family)
MMLKLRELLNCILWHPSERREKADYLITCRDGRTVKHFHMNEITRVDSFGFTTFDGTYIPLHRIRTVKKDSEIIWQKNT